MNTNIRCPFCGEGSTLEAAVESGWTPTFWLDSESESESPCCPDCHEVHLHDPDGASEPVLKPGNACFLSPDFLGIPEDCRP